MDVAQATKPLHVKAEERVMIRQSKEWDPSDLRIASSKELDPSDTHVVIQGIGPFGYN